MILPYQKESVKSIINFLPQETSIILEVGSDIPGLVASSLAEETGALVIGINPSDDFPTFENRQAQNPKTFFVRGDGRFLPFPDNYFDAIISLATMEHILGISSFLNEVERVLKPKGLFYSSFEPIWSSAKGHHVYVVSQNKEVRFWKPGKNPVPDFAHLYMTPDEMRSYLSSGPCSDDLIEPIISWIYYEDAINRYHFEHYIDDFKKSPLLIERITCRKFNEITPDKDTLNKLKNKYTLKENFHTSNITVLFRKYPDRKYAWKYYYFIYSVRIKKVLHWVIFQVGFQVLKRFPELKPLAKKVIKTIRTL